MNFQSLMQSLMESRKNTRLIAVDEETGGINCHRHKDDESIPEGMTGADHFAILQFAAIVYDGYFNQIGEELNIVIYHSEEELEKRVGAWSKNEFKDTLMIQCPKSKISLEEAEQLIIKHLEKAGITNNQSAFMVGNSIRLDMEFLVAQMPQLEEYFHYRLIDVSTLKSIFNMLFGKFAYYKKEGKHDALSDIRESMGELKFYLDNFIVSPEEYIRNKVLGSVDANETVFITEEKPVAKTMPILETK